MNLFAVSSFLWTAITLGLGFFVLRAGKTKILRMWAIFNFLVTIWAFGNAMAGISKDENNARFWWFIAHMFGPLSGVFMLHLVCVIGGIRRRVLLAFGYFEMVLFSIFSYFKLAGTDLQYLFNEFYYMTPSYYALKPLGINFPVHIYIFLFYVYYALFELFRVYQRSEGQEKTRIGLFLLGLVLAYVGAGTMMFLPVFGIMLYPYWNVSAPLYFGVVTYAILRHNMFDIEVIIKKTLVFAGLLASVFAILILPTLLIQEYIFRSVSFGGRLVGLTISGVIIILTMRRIETFLINITDRYLFQKKYDYKELLKTFTSEVLTVLELDKLMDLTVTKLTDIVKLNSCAVLLFDDEKQQFEVMASNNIKDQSVTLIRPDGIVTFMDETHGYILLKEMHDKKITIPDSIQEIIDKLNAELIIPMVVHDEVIGVLSLGKKKSDEEYTQDDMDIFLPLAKTLAIAISNAKLFVELGKTQAEAAQKEKMAVIGTLSAGINHEICNPLGIARGQCEAFLLNIKDGLYKAKTTEELLKKAQEIMGKVIHETDRATSITKKLSGFAKPAKGESEIIVIDKEIDDVLGLVGYELKLEKIEIEKRIDTNIPNIFVDKKQFQEVLFNLIRNAGQAIGEKGKITISAYVNNGKVTIDIKDTGSGIPEDKVKQLFNPFFTTKDPGKGTGLGLFIVRQVVEKNGGRIHLKETKVGEGTTFTIEFPIATAEAKAGAKSK